MTDERHPLGIALKRPPKADPWPDPEPVLPLVVRRKSDTPEERRCLDVLEECSRRALDRWLRGAP